MADRYFAPKGVEALIPALTAIMERLMAAHQEVSELRERLQAEQQRIAIAGGAIIDREAWRADRERLQALAAEVQSGLAEIGKLGGVTKDLELGLVDFPHRREGREVNLCWKYGEREIRFWHGLDEGYASRQPL